MKTILRTLLILLTLVALPLSAKKSAEARILFTEKSYDFGDIPERGGAVSHEFQFQNQGDAPLVIIDARAQCGCTRSEFPDAPIAPGRTAKIKVTFNPRGLPGPFMKTITVRTNGSPSKTTLKIKGSVK